MVSAGSGAGVTSAAALIIGDELLAGRVEDRNSGRLVTTLAEIGVRLRRLVVLGDVEEEIAAEVKRLAAAHDVVITSGGLGPTHDDRTVAAVARAFGLAVVRHPELARTIHTLWGTRFTEAALRMADVPEGARLLWEDDGLLPVVAVRNVYLLPGIPSLFAAKLATLRRVLRGRPPVLARVFLASDESRLAPVLAAVANAHPHVKIGSYPTFHARDHRLLVTVEGEDTGSVEAALAALLEAFPGQELVRVERA